MASDTASLSAEPAVPHMVQLSRTACERCRKQKLRCSREHPICARCHRLSASCRYPQLADRKLLAARREAIRTDGVTRAHLQVPGTQGISQPNNSIVDDRQAFEVQSTNTNDNDQTGDVTLPVGERSTSAELPPRAIGLGLLEIYFERLYNAHLLFRRSELFECYLNDTVPSFLLRSIFALASRFLQHQQPQFLPLGCHSAPIPPELIALRSYASYGPAWAVAAAQEALQLSERPSIESIQTLACLSIYWFSRNEKDRARIHIDIIEALAYTSCANFLPLSIQPLESQSKNVFSDLERKRSCYWACWASICTAAIPEAYARNAWVEVCGIPLPLSKYELQLPESYSRECMDESWHCRPCIAAADGTVRSTHASIMGEFMKLMGIWARIQILVRQDSAIVDVSQLKALFAAADRVFSPERFPAPYFGHRATTQEDVGLLGLHSLYHLCRMVSLCPLVAVFSGRHRVADTASSARANAAVVAEHALLHCRLMHDYVLPSKSRDITKISSLTAFACFVATSILLTLITARARRARTARDDLGQTYHQVLMFVRDTLGILDSLQTFWEPLRPMAKLLQQKAAVLPLSSSDPGPHMSFESPREVRLPLTGVNSPSQDNDGITMTYMQTPGYSTLPDDSMSSSHAATNMMRGSRGGEVCLDDDDDRASQNILGSGQQHFSDSFLEGYEEALDFNPSDWDLDFLALWSAEPS